VPFVRIPWLVRQLALGVAIATATTVLKGPALATVLPLQGQLRFDFTLLLRLQPLVCLLRWL